MQDVMDMSKLESGAMILDVAPLVLRDVLDAAVEDTRDLFAARKQTLTINADAGLPGLDGDARRLRQLLVHLLSNANKFTAEGGRILVLARATADGSLTIAIADTGVGMTHEQIVLAMKPFAQVQGHLTRTQEGAGLGLPISLGIARLHGGSLFLDSQPGAGTTAVITLPVRAAGTGTNAALAPREGQAA
jgi:two-component system cell cycle sensor histidine kinase PleC